MWLSFELWWKVTHVCSPLVSNKVGRSPVAGRWNWFQSWVGFESNENKMRNGSTPSLDLNLDNHQPQIEQIKFTFVFTLACICYSGPKGFRNGYFEISRGENIKYQERKISNIRREKYFKSVSTGTTWCACHFGSYPPTYKSGDEVYLYI